MKKILVPTDFSEQAGRALKTAASIARKTGSELILLHIIDLPQEAMDAVKPGFDVPEIIFFKNSAEARLSQTSLSPELNGLTVSQVLRLGRTFDLVNEVATANDVDLIVMGSHGASGFKEVFIGSNTEKVVRTSEIPVLVIKNEETLTSFNKVVFAVDLGAEVKESTKKMIKFLISNEIKPVFLYVNTPNNFKSTHVADKMAKEYIQQLSINDYEFAIYNDVDIEKGILNYAESINADLIAMGTHGRTGFARLLNGSISEDLVNHSSKSVLTFKL
ncbi:MAG TPA: universal stress protein [Flavobacterium sp.]|nr:universal stress protein [Flavobacterium sp.]